MTNQHPITPPLEVMLKLRSQFHNGETLEATWTLAFQAGADQELEACCEWLYSRCLIGGASELLAARRPKPPSLKEQALAALKRYEAEVWCEEMTSDSNIIRRALEALPE
jgi:hypothetical protein